MGKKGDKYCKKLGGEVKDGLCDVGGYPAPYEKEDIDYCAPVATDAVLFGDGLVMRLSPEDAKRLFPEVYYHEPSIEKLRGRMKNREALCPPWLEVCFPDKAEHVFATAESCFIGHEGRHRIEAAIREGIKEIPIVVRLKPNYACSEKIKELNK